MGNTVFYVGLTVINLAVASCYLAAHLWFAVGFWWPGSLICGALMLLAGLLFSPIQSLFVSWILLALLTSVEIVIDVSRFQRRERPPAGPVLKVWWQERRTLRKAKFGPMGKTLQHLLAPGVRLFWLLVSPLALILGVILAYVRRDGAAVLEQLMAPHTVLTTRSTQPSEIAAVPLVTVQVSDVAPLPEDSTVSAEETEPMDVFQHRIEDINQVDQIIDAFCDLEAVQLLKFQRLSC